MKQDLEGVKLRPKRQGDFAYQSRFSLSRLKKLEEFYRKKKVTIPTCLSHWWVHPKRADEVE